MIWQYHPASGNFNGTGVYLMNGIIFEEYGKHFQLQGTLHSNPGRRSSCLYWIIAARTVLDVTNSMSCINILSAWPNGT